MKRVHCSQMVGNCVTGSRRQASTKHHGCAAGMTKGTRVLGFYMKVLSLLRLAAGVILKNYTFTSASKTGGPTGSLAEVK